ncbi:MAG: phosphoglucomutase [Thermodesulfobacteriota bacterium]
MRQEFQRIFKEHITSEHASSDYFGCIKEFLSRRDAATDLEERAFWQKGIDRIYPLIENELQSNTGSPRQHISFGTSGWRGILGKDLFCLSVAQVTAAIASIYLELEQAPADLRQALGVTSTEEARRRGCLLGFDNRFGGALLAESVMAVLTSLGFVVHYAGESTTGALSAALLRLNAAFSINLTPSHNPLQYGGFKYNAADGGPAASVITAEIGRRARQLVESATLPPATGDAGLIREVDAFALWQELVRANRSVHGLDYDAIIAAFFARHDLVVAVDAVHGASRIHLTRFFLDQPSDRLIFLRTGDDPTFGGVAPEPSSANLAGVREVLASRSEPLKLGMIIDPDADRIRFTDGVNELSMNHFGALAYHFLHTAKGRKGLVAKTVATSNFANAVAAMLGEEVFEPAVGFKEFKPVIGKALVCFEESDGISIIGHTPEKDAYIGMLLALDMIMTSGLNLIDYQKKVEAQCGSFHPARDGIAVSARGKELEGMLTRLEDFGPGRRLAVGDGEKTVKELITIDGYKILFEDDSWLMIRPSGTEPKVRFYVEARSEADQAALFAAARRLLVELGVVPG